MDKTLMMNEAFEAKPPEKLKEGLEDDRDDFLLRQKLAEARQKAGLSQSTVARLMGTQAPAISRIESDLEHSPSIRTLRNYARAIGCELQVALVPISSSKRRQWTSPPCLVSQDFVCISE